MNFVSLLIHLADTQSWLLVIIIFTGVIRLSVHICQYICRKSCKTKQIFKWKWWNTVGLAVWIIDGSCLGDPRGRPQSRPVVITIFTHSVRPSQNFKIKRQSLPGRDRGLAVWIIDDPCLVSLYLQHHENGCGN